MNKEALFFSSKEKELIERPLQSTKSHRNNNISFDEVYEIADTQEFILRGKFQRV